MPANEFYDSTGTPSSNTLASSASMRAEFDLVEVAFNKLPTMAGHANEILVVNSTGAALTTTTTPNLGTPSAGVATNLTGTATALNIGGNAATVTTNANLTGPVTSVGNATAIADAALSIAKTSGLQTALNAKALLAGSASQNFAANELTASGRISLTSGTLGYGTGAGGTVTQATSKSTAVVLNKSCGQITMNNAALAAGAIVQFQLSNSLILPTDTVILNMSGGTSEAFNYNVWAWTGNGSALIVVKNITAGSLSDALILNYSFIKGVTS